MKRLNKYIFIALLMAILIVNCQSSIVNASDRKTRVITFLSSGTYTAATAYSTGFDVSAYHEGQILTSITAEAGTSTLDITVQTSDDNSTYYDHTSCTQRTATGHSQGMWLIVKKTTTVRKLRQPKRAIGTSRKSTALSKTSA